ncbi:MAG: hypothetical protein KC422_09895 [Trueperaceae bacterium]|nr:hypothetical protein [Trueperaceae bacterium]
MKKPGLYILLLGFLAACSSPTDVVQGVINQAKADAIATAITTDSTEVIDSMTLVNLRPAELKSAALLGCVAVSGDITDFDLDLVPAAALFTFNCTAVGRYGVQASLTGQLGVTDPSTDLSVNGFDSSLNNLNLAVIGMQDTAYTELRNGTRTVRYQGSSLNYAQDLDITRTFMLLGVAASAQISNKLTYALSANGGETLSFISPLPDSSVTVTGQFDWQSGEDKLVFNVTTPQALQYDSSCETMPLFSSGELRASLVSAGGNGYIRIVYNGCGEVPTIRFITTS